MNTSTSMTAIPQNYKKSVEWILGSYTDAGVTFPNGFQKDAIQNAVGARKTNSWKNWSCDISLIETPKGEFVVVTDQGTVGLTGANIPAEDITHMMSNQIELAPNNRLARFTSMFNSGGNTTGGGLFGAGKSVYSVASNDCTYYFDSLREDNLYVANFNNCGQVFSKALEDETAKNYILDETGLYPLSECGTRIIIKNPKPELKESITSGSILQFIQESWWLILERLDESSYISVNGNKITVPAGLKDATRKYELKNPETFSPGHKIKHFGLYVFDHQSIPWTGISYYRKGMRIGEIELNERNIPEKLQKKYWGYIEVDEQWEEDLAEIEDRVHFGVSKGKKNSSAYQHLKGFCNDKIRECFVEWGFIKEQRDDSQKLKEELRQIAEDLQENFHKLGFENLSIGPDQSEFEIRLQDISYPEPGKEVVTGGDEISFSLLVKSKYGTNKKFETKAIVRDPSTGESLFEISAEEFELAPNCFKKIPFSLPISEETSRRFAENRIEIAVKVPESSKQKTRELRYYFDADEPEKTSDNVVLSLHECNLPTKGSRRINFGEKIQGARYRINNNRNLPLSFKLNVSIHNSSDPSCPKIIDVGSLQGTVLPYEEFITDKLEDIVFSQEIYSRHLEEGQLELRARLIATADDDQYEKGQKITFYNFKLFLNCDEKNGLQDAFEIESVVAPDDYRRSWCNPGTKRSITLNVGHSAYKNLEDYPELQIQYLREQMMKQFVLLYLKEGKYEMFRSMSSEFAELDPQEAAERVLDKIEMVYDQLN